MRQVSVDKLCLKPDWNLYNNGCCAVQGIALADHTLPSLNILDKLLRMETGR